MKKYGVILCVLIFVLLLCGCNIRIKNEAEKLALYILENITNDNVDIADVSYSDSGILIELYGSDSGSDVMEILDACNEWIINNNNALINVDKMQIAVELYETEPELIDKECMNYVARLSNYSRDFNLEVGSSIDCVELCTCNNFYSSFFDGTDSYRVIILPSDVVLDSIECFEDMKDLQYLYVDIDKSPEDAYRTYEYLTEYFDCRKTAFSIGLT